MPMTLQISRKRSRKLVDGCAFAVIVALHVLLLLNFARPADPPTTLGDGSSSSIGLTVALVSDPETSSPSSQGADVATQVPADNGDASEVDKIMEAQGAGDRPQKESGGSTSPSLAKAAMINESGGGGGDKDDPFARVSMRPQLNDPNVFDLSHHGEIVFRGLALPCLRDTHASAPLTLAISLDLAGVVTSVRPAADAAAGTAAAHPDKALRAIAKAIRACGPYHDASIARELTFVIPGPDPA